MTVLGCKKEKVDYRVRARFVYKNETSKIVEVISNTPFTIKPLSEFIIEQDSDGGKDITAESYVPPFLDGVIVYDNIKCDTLSEGFKPGQGEGPVGIQNYESIKLSDRYYQFTYRFTEKQYQDAEDCK